MTPKEKARKLYNSFESQIYDVDVVDGGGWDNCRLVDKSVIAVTKQCAFIAVDDNIEELEHIKQYIDELDVNIINFQIHYLEQVKTEIENL